MISMIEMIRIGMTGSPRRLPRKTVMMPGTEGTSHHERVAATGSGEADSRIDIGVKDVNEKVDRQDQDRVQDDHRLQ